MKRKSRQVSVATEHALSADLDFPFVPDLELLECLRRRPSQSELALIGAALAELTDSTTSTQTFHADTSLWDLSSRLAQVSQRLGIE